VELQGLQSRIADIQASGAKVVAISADSIANNRRLADRLSLEYPVLSDHSLEVIASYGLDHRGAGVHGSDIARPATLLVGPDGEVLWRHLPDNWRVRVQPDELMSAIEAVTRSCELDPAVTPARG
jgi:peroxiredoxin